MNNEEFFMSSHALINELTQIIQDIDMNYEPLINNKGDDCCSICLDEITSNDILKTRCNHVFHIFCISNWKRKHNTCPNCREKI